MALDHFLLLSGKGMVYKLERIHTRQLPKGVWGWSIWGQAVIFASLIIFICKFNIFMCKVADQGIQLTSPWPKGFHDSIAMCDCPHQCLDRLYSKMAHQTVIHEQFNTKHISTHLSCSFGIPCSLESFTCFFTRLLVFYSFYSLLWNPTPGKVGMKGYS